MMVMNATFLKAAEKASGSQQKRRPIYVSRSGTSDRDRSPIRPLLPAPWPPFSSRPQRQPPSSSSCFCPSWPWLILSSSRPGAPLTLSLSLRPGYSAPLPGTHQICSTSGPLHVLSPCLGCSWDSLHGCFSPAIQAQLRCLHLPRTYLRNNPHHIPLST